MALKPNDLPVIFRKWNDTGSVIALFPTIPEDMSDPAICSSYEHVGQHEEQTSI